MPHKYRYYMCSAFVTLAFRLSDTRRERGEGKGMEGGGEVREGERGGGRASRSL